MKAAAAVMALAGVAALTASARAQVTVPPLPPVTVPTVPVPTVPVPAVPVPAAQVPSPTAPSVPTPSVPATAPASPGQVVGAVSAAQEPVAGAVVMGSASSSSPSSSSSRSGSAPSYTAESRPTRVKHFESSRTWIATTGPRKRRTTTLTFVLPRAARVVFTVKQVAPVCRTVGRFTVAAKAGLNRVRFAGRLRGRDLEPGTYRISARTRTGRIVKRVILVVVDFAAPSPSEFHAARAANVCDDGDGATAADGSADAATASLAAVVRPQAVQRSFAPREQPAAIGPADEGDVAHPGGVLASTVERTARAVRPFLVALLALSILLLGMASLPAVAVANDRVNDLLVRHRIEIAAMGAAALVAVAVAFAIG
jgi:hypothetical protein